ncbi:hypothetical protein Tco_0575294 [Tanacetum coccineum]
MGQTQGKQSESVYTPKRGNFNQAPASQLWLIKVKSIASGCSISAFMKQFLPSSISSPSSNSRLYQNRSVLIATAPRCPPPLVVPVVYHESISEPANTPNFIVVDFEPDPRVPLILGRSFLKTSRALIDVYEGEITLRVGRDAHYIQSGPTSRYTADYNHMTANRIDVIDMACEEYSQEVLGFSNVISSGNPTPYYDPIVSTSSPTLTPFGDSDFLLFEEADSFLASKRIDPTSRKYSRFPLEPEGCQEKKTTLLDHTVHLLDVACFWAMHSAPHCAHVASNDVELRFPIEAKVAVIASSITYPVTRVSEKFDVIYGVCAKKGAENLAGRSFFLEFKKPSSKINSRDKEITETFPLSKTLGSVVSCADIPQLVCSISKKLPCGELRFGQGIKQSRLSLYACHNGPTGGHLAAANSTATKNSGPNSQSIMVIGLKADYTLGGVISAMDDPKTPNIS